MERSRREIFGQLRGRGGEELGRWGVFRFRDFQIEEIFSLRWSRRY